MKCGEGMSINEVIDEIVEKCKKYEVEKVVLYGSWAKGTALERSDIDIAVYGVEKFCDLQDEIENIPTLYKIDMVCVDECQNKLLLEDIETYGRKIYEAI